MIRDHCGVMKAWEATVRKTQAAAKKRASSFFGTISVAHADDDDDSVSHSHSHGHNPPPRNSEVYQSDRVLPNGDYYTGQWADSFPHGVGKYIWTDGCMYIGEWWVGKTNGRGRFTWPSGATYDGEFKSGYMDGKGVYMGANGDTFKGNFVMNLKHGDGVQSYANGDCYDGEWSRGSQDGHGKYQWRNGNYYLGEWKNGVICGKGNFFWSNGNRFDGFWDEGFPKGNGTLWFLDGSFYMGNWSMDPNEQNGTYYPSDSENKGIPHWDPQQLFSHLSDSEVCQCEKVSILPSQKKLAVWRSSKGSDPGVKPKRMSVDSRLNDADVLFDKMHMLEGGGDVGSECRASNVYDSFSGLLAEGVDFVGMPLQKMRVPRTSKRPGETISKGHRNYELMLNLQLGIRHSVGRQAPAVSLDLKASAFDPKQKVWTRFPPEGSKYTPPHQSCDFRWKDYCPLVFRTLRKLFKVDAADYMISICGNDALRELSSPGKSGSFFYLTNDDRYMIKTMKKSEVKVLLRMLSAYYNHARAFENTMLTKFYGLHCVKVTGTAQKKVRFIIMGNLFCSNYTIHRRFDLKGSSLGRTTCKSEAEIDDSTILKDLDLNFIFRIQKSWFQEFYRQIDKDCEFLEQERIMDYSLLVGIHFRETSSAGELIPSGTQTPTGDSESSLTPSFSSAGVDQLLLDPSRWSGVRLGLNMPGRVERTVRRNDSENQLVGEPTGELYDVVVFFGIIDILQDYDISKKLEHAYKSFQYDPASISAVDPKQYSKRFRDFLLAIFHEDN